MFHPNPVILISYLVDEMVSADRPTDESSGSGESGGESSGSESDRTVMASGLVKAKPPGYYDTLVAQHGTTELRTGLVGARVPGDMALTGAGDKHPFHLRTSATTQFQDAQEKHTWGRSIGGEFSAYASRKLLEFGGFGIGI